jgi:hypothetical protein
VFRGRLLLPSSGLIKNKENTLTTKGVKYCINMSVWDIGAMGKINKPKKKVF